ncbi:uncharacterized protein LOC132039164 [Lycium ferocissimum]|uniref:uncharacterized protein LOC132039164 n=1 Tax=Lycium ferocissimum TaxID=112874 RepID=UPI002816699A|nr:uncharacterized protein LOC132039164 [Lycium ferocissimum]
MVLAGWRVDNEQPQPQLQTPVLKQELKEVDSLKDEVSKLKIKQLQLLVKDLNGMGLNELWLLEHQLMEGLLAVKNRKEELLIQQLEHSRRQGEKGLDSDTLQLDELRGLFPKGASLPPFVMMHPVLKEGEKGLDSDAACEVAEYIACVVTPKSSKLEARRKRKEPEMGCDSSNSENQVGSK